MSTENTSTAVAGEIPNLLITPTAQEYLKDLLEKQNTPGIGVRVFVENPGTPRAECCMAYSAPDEVVPTDYKQDYPDFPAFIDSPSIPYNDAFENNNILALQLPFSHGEFDK